MPAFPRRSFALLLGYLAAYSAWQALSGETGATKSLVGDLWFVPLNTAALVAAWRAGGRCSAAPCVRSGWRLIALGLGCYLVGDVLQALYEGVLKTEPYPSAEDVFYLSFYPITLLGLLRFRAGRLSAAEHWKVLVETALVVIGGGTIVWYLVLGPTAVQASGSMLQTVFSIGYPVGDLVLILGIANLHLRRMVPSVRGPVRWMGLALVFFVTADMIYGWEALHDGYQGGDAIDFLYIVSIGLFGLAATAQPRASAHDEAGEVERTRWAWLPFVAAAAVFGMLVAADAHESFFPGMSLTLAALAVAFLAGMRQFISHRELLAAHRDLNDAHDELSALATTDPVTMLPNHRALVATIERELERARRFGRPCSLLFLDIDRFKALNDQRGHGAGDATLKELGFVATDVLRGMDTAGRWGGEEFLVLLPEVDAAGALGAAERVRQAVASHLFGAAGGVHVTCSIGIATYPDDASDREALVEAADRAMYTAKSLGRNQVVAWSDPAVAAMAAGTGTIGSADVTLMDAVETLAQLVDVRDNYTGAHAADVAGIARRLTLEIGAGPDEAQTIGVAARLHDIGKVGIADAILQKPGKLSDAEWDQMRRHPVLGAEVISRIPTLRTIVPLVRGHHERWDGKGYPDGLKGEEIPLGARIIAIADAYDAMVTGRPYRAARSPEEALAELERCAGTQFDPNLVAAVRDVIRGANAAVVSGV